MCVQKRRSDKTAFLRQLSDKLVELCDLDGNGWIDKADFLKHGRELTQDTLNILQTMA